MKNTLTKLSIATASICLTAALHAEMLDLEKDELKFGFIKLSDAFTTGSSSTGDAALAALWKASTASRERAVKAR